MLHAKENIDDSTLDDLLDKVILKQLHLIEDKLNCELKIESSINNGSIHLAKSRYIMGQSSVSTARLPVDNSPEFSATTVCVSVEENGVKLLKVIENKTGNTVNPLHWFGVLVPQNLHKAQNIFQNTLNYIAECVNIQLQIQDNNKNIEALRKYVSLNKSK